MKKLLNTLYVIKPEAYLGLDGENIVILIDNKEVNRFPLHNLEGVVSFGYIGASPALMGKCAKNNISLSFMNPHGRFICRVVGEEYGNVLLRKEQYKLSSDLNDKRIKIVKNMISGKIINCKNSIDRFCRDNSLRVNTDLLKSIANELKNTVPLLSKADSLETIRGIEGQCAAQYFSIFDDFILNNKDQFFFKYRNKRPPLDNVNALLSFTYTLLAKDVASALESVGLDPYVGFMHADRPGRISLALDLMEELRPILCDRFVFSLINRKMINGDDFEKTESGAVIMNEKTLKLVLTEWQKKKNETLKHPYLNLKTEWGMIPFVQAQLLAKTIREDIEEYPPFLWK